jgi:L-2-hydroxyglutarate oxidase LhgO
MPDKKYDIAIIGAGVVGLAIASKLSKHKSNPKVIVLEKYPTYGKESSGRNSGVIHAGIYYKKNSLKALLCVEGNRLLYDLCRNSNIPFRKTGKYVIAVNESEISLLNSLFKRAQDNGVNGIHFCSSEELKEYRSRVKCLKAINSPNSGIVDFVSLMKYLEFVSIENRVKFLYNSQVVEIHYLSDKYKIYVNNNNHINKIESQKIINSAGLEADKIAEIIGIDILKYDYSQYYTRGEYFKVKNQNVLPADKLIYRVRDGYKIGTHTVINTKGEISLGPYTYKTQKEINYSIDPSNIRNVYNDSIEYLPHLMYEDLSPFYSGLNPRLNGQDRDYIIKEESDRGYPGCINLIGMSSPALTSCLAIANLVEKILN